MSVRFRLEVEFQRQLNLPWVIDRPGRAVERIRRAFQVSGCAGAAECRRIHGTKIRRTIYSVEEPNIGRVEKIERLRDYFHVSLFAEGNGACDAEIDGTEIVAGKRVAWFDADAVVVSKDVPIGVESSEFGEAHGRLNRGDQTEEEVARKRIPGLRSCNRSVHDHPVAHIVGRECALGAEILAVLGYQHKAGIRPIIDGLCPSITDAVRQIVRQPLVYVDQQTVILRIPPRRSFEINRNREGAYARIERARHGSHSAILIFGTRPPTRIVQSYNLRWIRLVHVEEAAKVNTANMQTTDADGRVRQRIEFQRQTGLYAVRILVILIEAHDHGRPKESTFGDWLAGRKWIRERVRGVIRIRSVFYEALQCKRSDHRRAGKREKFRLGVQSIFKRTARILADCSTAGGLLACEQWRWNDAVEQPQPGAHNNVALRSNIVGEAEARIDVLPLGVEHVRGPGFPFPTYASIESEPAGGAPFVLNVETVVRVVHLALRGIADGGRKARPCVDRSIQALLVEIRSLKTLEEDHIGMLAASRSGTTGIGRRRHTLRAYAARRSVISQKCTQAREIRLEWIEQRKRFRGVHKIEVATETDGVAVKAARHIVNDLKARLAVKIRIAAIDSRGERIGELQVRLRGNGRKIKRAARILHAQLVHQFRIDDRCESAGKRLIAVKIVLERGRQIEAVVQRGLVEQAALVDEIADEEIFAVAEAMIDAGESVVGVVGAQDTAEVWFRRETIDGFHFIDCLNVREHGRIVKRRLASALCFVICIDKGLILLQRTADRGAELILAQHVGSRSLQ